METLVIMSVDELIAYMECCTNDFIIHVQLEEEGKSVAQEVI